MHWEWGQRRSFIPVARLGNVNILRLPNVPDEVIDQLTVLAQREGMPLSAFVVRELSIIATRVNNARLLDQLPDLNVPPGAIVAGLESDRRST